MRTSRAEILANAERVFDSNGFAASGMDALTHAAGVSTRTLYKHVGGKSDLVAAVLRARRARFFERFDVDDVDSLFLALEAWVEAEGARGCLFLRAAGELGGGFASAVEEVAVYRAQLRDLVQRLVEQEGASGDGPLADQILVLFEGATSAASYCGAPAISAARGAAAVLLNRA